MEPKEVYRGGQHKVVCDGKYHFGIDKQNRQWPEGKCWCKERAQLAQTWTDLRFGVIPEDTEEDLRTYFTPSDDLLSPEDMRVK